MKAEKIEVSSIYYFWLVLQLFTGNIMEKVN